MNQSQFLSKNTNKSNTLKVDNKDSVSGEEKLGVEDSILKSPEFDSKKSPKKKPVKKKGAPDVVKFAEANPEAFDNEKKSEG